jgi:sugar/nucleoside kinase (ribokinase family)
MRPNNENTISHSYSRSWIHPPPWFYKSISPGRYGLTNTTGLKTRGAILDLGSDELWYARKGQQLKEYKSYTITPVNATGAGDSFRAGIIYGILKSWDYATTIDFASAVSACVCLTMPHTFNAPGLDGILAFMKNHKRDLRKTK